MPHCDIKIETFTPDKEQLKAYALAFKEAIQKWQNYLGDSIYMSHEGWEEDAEELRELISKATPSRCITLLKKNEIIPEKLYRVIQLSTGVTESLPIYTGIRQISLEGNGSVLAEAFFGAEVHLLDAAGRLLSVYDHEYSPKLGLSQLYLIDLNSLYDSQVKGRRDDPTAMEIVGYAYEGINRNFSFHSEYGKEYILKSWNENEKTITGTGEYITVTNLSRLGKYTLIRKSNKDEAADDWMGLGAETWVHELNYHVGLEWKNIPDFTIQYNTFPFLEERDSWVLQSTLSEVEEKIKLFKERWQDSAFILYNLQQDPFSFQFMPIEIRDNRKWIERVCLENPVNFLYVGDKFKNDKKLAIDLIKLASEDTVYPYLTQHLRKNLDILITLKEVDRLYDLPNPDEIGEEKIKDISEFVLKNKSRIEEILNLFPNALRYAPKSILNNRELIIKALPLDNELVSFLPQTLRDDPEVIMAASSEYFTALEFASQRLCEDSMFVISILGINGKNIQFAADWMKSDRNFVLAAVNAGSRIFDYVPEHFRDDEEIILKMIKANGYSLESASERLRKDKAFNLKALDHGAYYEHCIHKSLLIDRDIVLKAIQKRPHEFKNIPEQFKSDREIVMTVVSRKGGYSKYIADCSIEMRDDPEIIKAAVKDNGSNIKHASQRLLEDYYYLAEIIYEQPDSIKHMPDAIKNDPVLCELARRRKIELSEIKINESKPDNNENDDFPF